MPGAARHASQAIEARRLIAQIRAGDASPSLLACEIATLVHGKQGLVPSPDWVRLASSRPTQSLDGALLVFKYPPFHISTDPNEVCILALEQYL